MKNRKLIFTILFTTLLLTSCGNDNSSTSVDVPNSGDSTTSEVNPLQVLLDDGFREVKGWPQAPLKLLLTREEVEPTWVDANVPTDSAGTSETTYLVRNTEFDEGVTTFKTMDILKPIVLAESETGASHVDAYVSAFNTEIWTVTTISETSVTAKALADDKLNFSISFVEATEELTAYVSYSYTVKEKEEFPGALKPTKTASRIEISFSNDIRIKARSLDLVRWDFLGFSFSVEKDISETTVGNIPNNNGAGYLTSPLRVYESQKLTFSMTDKRLEQVIIHTQNYSDGGTEIVSLDALPKYDDALAKTFVVNQSILYHFHTEISTFSFNISANARLLDVVAIYS